MFHSSLQTRIHTLFSPFSMLFVCLLSASSGASPPNLEQFLAQSDEWLRHSGSIVLTYEASEDAGGAGRRTDGFDPVTGAWFSASSVMVSGRTPEGVVYSGSPGPGQLQALPDQTPRLPAPMQDLLPIALAVELRRTTEGLTDITRLEDGAWVVEYASSGPDASALPTARVVFADDGTPLRFERGADPASGRSALSYNYEFEPETARPLLVVVQRTPARANRKPLQLVDVQQYKESRPELFSMDAVEALGIDNRMRALMRFNELALKANRAPAGDGITPVAPYVDYRVSRVGWPLIITGIVVVSLGLFALIRSRSGK